MALKRGFLVKSSPRMQLVVTREREERERESTEVERGKEGQTVKYTTKSNMGAGREKERERERTNRYLHPYTCPKVHRLDTVYYVYKLSF